MLLLDRAIKMAAEQDEPDEMNFVRKHARQQAAEMGMSLRDAATRVFSNSSGSYSSNVNLAVENSSWSDEQQLQVRAGWVCQPCVLLQGARLRGCVHAVSKRQSRGTAACVSHKVRVTCSVVTQCSKLVDGAGAILASLYLHMLCN